MRRPIRFDLNYDHHLAQGLEYFGSPSLGRETSIDDVSFRNLQLSKAGAGSSPILFWEDVCRNAVFVNSGSIYYYNNSAPNKIPVESEPISLSVFLESDTNGGIGGTTGLCLAHSSYGQSLGVGLARKWNGSAYANTAYIRKMGYSFTFELPAENYVVRHLCGVFESQSLRHLYVNGVLVLTDTTTITGWPTRGTYIGYDGSYSGYIGRAADPIIHSRALSPYEVPILADRTDPMLGGLIVEERPVLYFDMGGSTVNALTASNLTVSAPVLGTPAISQTHTFAVTGITIPSPVLETPVIGQVHALTAAGITISAPVIGSPALGQVHGLAATALTVSAPVLDTPEVGQAHSLVASALVVGSPVLGTPLLSENAPDIDALTAVDLVVGSPVLGTPAIGQTHSLTAVNLSVASPVLGTPSLEIETDNLVANSLVVGSPALGAPALGQIHVLGSDGLVTGAPVLGSPSITQIHALEALGLTVGVPVLGMPEFAAHDVLPITADEVARIVRASSRMKTVTASARVKQVRYEVTRA